MLALAINQIAGPQGGGQAGCWVNPSPSPRSFFLPRYLAHSSTIS